MILLGKFRQLILFLTSLSAPVDSTLAVMLVFRIKGKEDCQNFYTL